MKKITLLLMFSVLYGLKLWSADAYVKVTSPENSVSWVKILVEYKMNGNEYMLLYDCIDKNTEGDIDLDNVWSMSGGNGKHYYITEIDINAFCRCNKITSVTCSRAGFTTIHSGAFYGCSSLVSVSIPYVQEIENQAFSNCSSLKNIDFTWETSKGEERSSLYKIGNDAFTYCSTLESFYIPESLRVIGNNVWGYCSALSSFIINENNQYFVTENGILFNNDKTILYRNAPANTNSSYVIPNTVTTIKESAFLCCPSLTTLKIPNSVTSIENNAFSGCNKLNDVTVECTTPLSISSGTFSNRTNATLHVPTGCKSAYETAEYWKDFKEILEIPIIFTEETEYGINMTFKVTDINNKTCQVGDGTNAAITLKNGDDCITIPSVANGYTVTAIGDYAFAGLDDDDVEELEIPSTVEYIGTSAFSGFKDLRDIYIRDLEAWFRIVFETASSNPMYRNSSLYIIDNNNISVTDLVVPNTITTINDYTFYGCRSLNSVEIHDKVSSLGDYSFYNCNNLRSVTLLSSSPITISSNTFSNRNQIVLYIPYGSKSAYEAADYWKDFKEIIEMGEDITIGSAGIGTYCSTHALDFSGTDDIKAYIVSAFKPSTGEVTLTRITDVPANTGIVVKGEADTYTIPWGPGETIVSNMLVGVTENTVLNKVDGDYTNYILAKKNGNLGFYAVSDGSTLSAGKAYLPLPTASLPSGAREFKFVFGDDQTTGIKESLCNSESHGDIYDLQGRRIEKPSHGLYIVNGKKVIIK